jgi:hypothetical protein
MTKSHIDSKMIESHANSKMTKSHIYSRVTITHNLQFKFQTNLIFLEAQAWMAHWFSVECIMQKKKNIKKKNPFMPTLINSRNPHCKILPIAISRRW